MKAERREEQQSKGGTSCSYAGRCLFLHVSSHASVVFCASVSSSTAVYQFLVSFCPCYPCVPVGSVDTCLLRVCTCLCLRSFNVSMPFCLSMCLCVYLILHMCVCVLCAQHSVSVAFILASDCLYSSVFAFNALHHKNG